MQLTFLNLFDREVPVDNEYSQVEGLGHQAELAVNINNPLHEEGSAGVLDFSLDLDLREIVRVDTQLLFLCTQILKNLCSIFRDLLGISHLNLVTEGDNSPALLAISQQSLLELFSNLRSFVAALFSLLVINYLASYERLTESRLFRTGSRMSCRSRKLLIIGRVFVATGGQRRLGLSAGRLVGDGAESLG